MEQVIDRKFNVYAQILISQLNNLYWYFDQGNEQDDWYLKTHLCCARTDLLYDYLKDEGKMNMDVSKEIKDQLWRLSLIKLKSDKKTIIKYYENLVPGEEKDRQKASLSKDRANIYKSMLLRYILGEKLTKDNQRLNLEYEDGTVIKQLTITGK